MRPASVYYKKSKFSTITRIQNNDLVALDQNKSNSKLRPSSIQKKNIKDEDPEYNESCIRALRDRTSLKKRDHYGLQNYELASLSKATRYSHHVPSIYTSSSTLYSCDTHSYQGRDITVTRSSSAIQLRIQVLCEQNGKQSEIFKKSEIFHPLFTNQIFGREEEIRGYTDLSIDICFSPSTLFPLIQINYTNAMRGADDIMQPLKNLFIGGYQSQIKRYQSKRRKQIQYFIPQGNMIFKFQRIKSGYKTQNYEVFKINANDPKFSKINLRLQAMILLFINGANFIYLEPFWKYFMLYRVVSMTNGKKLYQLVAYSTVYECPNKLKSQIFEKTECQEGLQEQQKMTESDCMFGRQTNLRAQLGRPNSKENLQQYVGKPYLARISQFIVLPPSQRQGFGQQLVEIIYNHYLQDKRCKQIDVQDPNIDFRRVRDSVQLKLILKRGLFASLWAKRPLKKVNLVDMSNDENRLRTSNFSIVTKQNYKHVRLTEKQIQKTTKEIKISRERVSQLQYKRSFVNRFITASRWLSQDVLIRLYAFTNSFETIQGGGSFLIQMLILDPPNLDLSQASSKLKKSQDLLIHKKQSEYIFPNNKQVKHLLIFDNLDSNCGKASSQNDDLKFL